MTKRRKLIIGKEYYVVEQGSTIEAKCIKHINKSKHGRYCKSKYLFKRPDGKLVVRNPYKVFDTKESAIIKIKENGN